MGLSNLGQKLARIGRDTKHGVQKMSDSVSIRSRISAEKRSLERLYAVIGESVYKENPEVPKKGLEDEYAAVKVAYANIEKYSRQLDKVNGIVYCPNCGKPADPGDKFCAKCGTRLTPEEGTASKVASDFKEVGKEMGKIAGSAADKTGELFGSAAAKTKNGFTSLKDKSKALMKNTSQRIGRKKAGGAPEDDALDVTEDVMEEAQSEKRMGSGSDPEGEDAAAAEKEGGEAGKPAAEAISGQTPSEEPASGQGSSEKPAQEQESSEEPASGQGSSEKPEQEKESSEEPVPETEKEDVQKQEEGD